MFNLDDDGDDKELPDAVTSQKTGGDIPVILDYEDITLEEAEELQISAPDSVVSHSDFNGPDGQPAVE